MVNFKFTPTTSFNNRLPQFPGDNKSLITPTFVDLDGDGLLDFVSGVNNGNILFFKNVGSALAPDFSGAPQVNPFNLKLPNAPVSGSPFKDARSAPTFVDLDGDGDFDAFVGEYEGSVYVFRNNGTPTNPDFGAAAENPFGISLNPTDFYVAPTLFDIDGDGDLDLFVARYTDQAGNVNDGNITFFRNQKVDPLAPGDPVFARDDAANPFNGISLPARGASRLTFIERNRLDPGDTSGLVDAVIAYQPNLPGGPSPLQGQLLYLKNTGTLNNPVFELQTGANNPFAEVTVGNPAVSFIDFNGNGRWDMVVGGAFGISEGVTLFLNQPFVPDVPDPLADPNFLRADASNIFTVGAQGGSNLQLRLAGENASQISRVQLKFLDAGNAVTEAIDLFSVLPAAFRPNGFSVGLESYIFSSVAAGERFVIELQTFDGRTIGFGSNSLQVTNIGQGQWRLAFEEGDDSSFDDIILTIEQTPGTPPPGVGSLQRDGFEVLDLSGIASAQVTFTVYREAVFNNVVGFYRLDDVTGAVGGLAPGQPGYAQAAIENRVPGLDISVANQSVAQFSATLAGNALYAPFLIANSDPFTFLQENPDNLAGGFSAAYFIFTAANPDGVDHVRLLGNNLFGFEDLPGGGDFDYNDMILNISVTPLA